MFRTRPSRTLSLLALIGAPSLLGCSSTDSGPHQPPISTDGVVFEGEASVAQLKLFLPRQAKDWAWAGGQFDAPDDQATLDASTSQTFSWHADPADFAESDVADDVVMTHLLVFTTSHSNALLRVFTTLPEYTPDTAAWQALAAEHRPIRVSLTTGSFVGAELPEDGGPFIGQVLTFTIE